MRPTPSQLLSAVCEAGRLLGVGRATYCFEGRFSLTLCGDWSLVISSDDAGRLRLDACLEGRVRATMWTPASDAGRFETLVLAAATEAAVLVA